VPSQSAIGGVKVTLDQRPPKSRTVTEPDEPKSRITGNDARSPFASRNCHHVSSPGVPVAPSKVIVEAWRVGASSYLHPYCRFVEYSRFVEGGPKMAAGTCRRWERSFSFGPMSPSSR
jgi:hypothetical protein